MNIYKLEVYGENDETPIFRYFAKRKIAEQYYKKHFSEYGKVKLIIEYRVIETV
jgi:hypothetical protein